MLPPSAREWLRHDPLWLAVTSLFVVSALVGAVGWYYADHYQPLAMGSSWGSLDTRSVQQRDGSYHAVIQYQAGRTWSYATSVRNEGHWAVDLTGAEFEQEPAITGAKSDCEVSITCLRSASWSYGPVSRTWKPSDGDRDAWHPLGSFHLAPGDEVMVRLTFVFGRCAQDNQGTAGFRAWTAAYSFFGRRRAVVPFDAQVDVLPLPSKDQHLPADCPPVYGGG